VNYWTKDKEIVGNGSLSGLERRALDTVRYHPLL